MIAEEEKMEAVITEDNAEVHANTDTNNKYWMYFSNRPCLDDYPLDNMCWLTTADMERSNYTPLLQP